MLVKLIVKSLAQSLQGTAQNFTEDSCKRKTWNSRKPQMLCYQTQLELNDGSVRSQLPLSTGGEHVAEFKGSGTALSFELLDARFHKKRDLPKTDKDAQKEGN